MFRVQIGHAYICLRTPYQTLSTEFFKLRNEFYFNFADLVEASYFVVNGRLFKRFQHVFRPFGAPKSIANTLNGNHAALQRVNEGWLNDHALVLRLNATVDEADWVQGDRYSAHLNINLMNKWWVKQARYKWLRRATATRRQHLAESSHLLKRLQTPSTTS